MTTVQPIESNPFALLMNPEAIFAAIAASDRLARLKSRVCRPLDQPQIALADDDATLFDEAADATVEQEESRA